jgi:Rod binding domain-containing protein
MTVPVPPTGPAAAGSSSSAASGRPDSTIRQAAEGFEGIFMSMLVDEMMKGTEVAQANPVYSGLMTQKLGDQLAASGGIGLADILEKQLGGQAPSQTGGV